MPELPDDLKPNDLPLTAEERLEGIAKFLACVLALLTAFYGGMLYVNF